MSRRKALSSRRYRASVLQRRKQGLHKYITSLIEWGKKLRRFIHFLKTVCCTAKLARFFSRLFFYPPFRMQRGHHLRFENGFYENRRIWRSLMDFEFFWFASGWWWRPEISCCCICMQIKGEEKKFRVFSYSFWTCDAVLCHRGDKGREKYCLIGTATAVYLFVAPLWGIKYESCSNKLYTRSARESNGRTISRRRRRRVGHDYGTFVRQHSTRQRLSFYARIQFSDFRIISDDNLFNDITFEMSLLFRKPWKTNLIVHITWPLS